MPQDFTGARSLTRALACLQGGDYPAALRCFEVFLTAEAENTAAREAAARAAERMEDWPQVARHWFELHNADPTAIGPVRRHVAALFKSQDWRAAESFCDRAAVLRENRHRMEATRYRLRILLERGDLPAAEKLTITARQDAPVAPGLTLALAEGWLAAGYACRALDLARTAPPSDDRERAWLIARALVQKQAWQAARITLEPLLNGPMATRARLALARNAAAQKDEATARRHYEAVRQDAPDHPEAVAQLARLAIVDRDPGQAIALLEDHGKALTPARRAHLRARAAHLQQPGGGREVFQPLLRSQPRNIALQIAFARHLREIAALEEARALVDTVLESAPEHIEALRLRMAILRDANASDDLQLAAAEAALAQLPQDAGLLHAVGGLLARKDREAGAAFYRSAIERAPRSAVLWRNGVYHTWMCNRVEEARRLADQALERLGAAEAATLADVAWIEQAAGRLERALRLIDRAVRAEPSDIRTISRAVDICMEAGSYARAWSHLERLDRLQPERRSPGMAEAAARCTAAFRAVARASGGAQPMVPAPVPGRFPDRLFDAIAACAKPDLSPGRSGILVLTSNLGAGGAERQVTYSIQGLSDRGPGAEPVTLAVNSLDPLQGNDFFLEEVRSAGIAPVELAAMHEGGAVRDLLAEAPQHAEAVRTLSALPPKIARVALPFYVLCVRNRPRVVHLWQDAIAVAGGMAAMLAGVGRIVLCTRSTRPAEIRRYRRFLRAGYRALDRYAGDVVIVNNSANGARDYENWLGLPEGRVQVFYNGYDFAAMNDRAAAVPKGRLRTELGIPPGAPVLGGVMRFSSVKRPDLWAKVAIAAARQQPDLHGLIVGDGPMRQEVMDHVARAGLSDRIHFAGRRSPVEPWMKAMDMLFLSSVTEGLPNVLIEAQAMGRPVVTMDVGGAAETIAPGKTGLALGEAPPQELGRKIAELLADRPRSAAMGRAARQHVEARFGLSRLIENLGHFYGPRSGPANKGSTPLC